MQCSEELIAKLFYNISSTFQIFLLFTYFTSILLAKIFYFFGGNPIIWRNQDGYDFAEFSDDEESEYCHKNDNHAERMEENHLVDNEFLGFEKDIEESCSTDEEESIYSSVLDLESTYTDDEVEVKEIDEDSDFSCYSENNKVGPTSSFPRELKTNGLTNMIDKDRNQDVTGNFYREVVKDKKVTEINLCREENIFVNAASSKLESKKMFQIVHEKEEDEIFGDSCTNGSTSKSSSEWRSSIKDSTTDDPFSSSSRRSCPKWESYTIFQKYDEEMLFFDRISAQKLHETGEALS